MYSLIERIEAPVGARQHHGALHGREHVPSERSGIHVSRQTSGSIRDQLRYGASPRVKILHNQLPDLRMTVTGFESKIPDGASQGEVGRLQQAAVAVENREDALDGIADPFKGGR